MALCILRAAWFVYATVSPGIVGVHAPAVIPGSHNCAHMGASWLSCVKTLMSADSMRLTQLQYYGHME